MTNEENFDPAWKNPFMFLSSPQTLLSIATSNFALLCWRHLFGSIPSKYEKFVDKDWFVKYEFNIDDILRERIPKHIKDLINRRMDSIGRELHIWWNTRLDHSDRNDYEDILKWIDHVILDSNGEICYRSIARSLLKEGKYNSVEKYKMACMYCVIEDILQLWPTISHLNFPYSPILHFWNSRMQNEPTRILEDEGNIWELILLLSRFHPMTRAQVEYFWNNLNVDSQTSLANLFLSKSDRSVVKYLLPKLNEVQFENALRIVSPEIIYALAEGNDEGYEYGLFVWNRVKHSIIPSEFYRLIKFLQKLALFPNIPITNDTRFLLYDIWIDAREDLRNFILNNHVRDIMETLSYRLSYCYYSWDRSGYDSDSRFYFDLWTRTRLEMRYELWRNYFNRLIFIVKPPRLHEFMKLCFDNGDSMVQFKRVMIDVKTMDRRFRSFIVQGLCDELIDYLRFCCDDDEHRVRKIMQQIIRNVNRGDAHRFRSSLKFNEFIDRAFLSANLANQCKREFIERILDNDYILQDGDLVLTTLRNTIDCLMSFDLDELNNLKSRFYRRSRDVMKYNYCTYKFHLASNKWDWMEFFKWCASSEEAIEILFNEFP